MVDSVIGKKVEVAWHVWLNVVLVSLIIGKLVMN